jgi:epoxyqueuosine reductase QueG
VRFIADALAVAALLDRLFPLWGVCADAPGSVLVAAFPYLLPPEAYAGRNIARYAVVRDYHDVCGARLLAAGQALEALYPGERFTWGCDASPMPEVALAEAAGLGRRGLHNLLITPEHGSWVFLGTLRASIALPSPAHKNTALGTLHASIALPSPAHKNAASANGCTGCRRCFAACPTAALGESGFQKERCISYLTQKKGALSHEEEALLHRGGSAWGCDLCQEACPCNAAKIPAPLPEFLIDPLPRLQPDAPLANRAYAWRGTAVLARNLRILAGATSLPQKKP